jgi:3-oxoacyl-[acyl-carrier protein] reductase
MKENGYGRIVSASSTTGLRGNYGQTNYAAAKAGIIGMTKTWALELGRYGITVNAICPGYTKTPMTDEIPENMQKLAIMQIPVGFLAEPIDIAYGYLYLASDEARFVSGIALPIDGGVTR